MWSRKSQTSFPTSSIFSYRMQTIFGVICIFNIFNYFHSNGCNCLIYMNSLFVTHFSELLKQNLHKIFEKNGANMYWVSKKKNQEEILVLDQLGFLLGFSHIFFFLEIGVMKSFIFFNSVLFLEHLLSLPTKWLSSVIRP